MSRLVRQLLMRRGGDRGCRRARERNCSAVPALPPVGLPLPAGNLPLAGPLLPDVLGQPGAQQAISPTLDTRRRPHRDDRRIRRAQLARAASPPAAGAHPKQPRDGGE